MWKMFGSKSLIVLAAGLNIFVFIAVGEPVCYSREQVDELNVKVTRVPCDEEEHKIFQSFDSSRDVTMTDLLGIKCTYETLPKVPHGSFKIKNCRGRSVTDTCRLTCDDGYALTSSTVETTCDHKGNNIAAWSLDEFSCHRFTCPFDELPNVSKGFINISDCSGNTGNDVCSVTCEDNHYPADSQVTICGYTGSQTGEWRPGNLSCLPISCPNDLPSVRNGRFTNCSGKFVHDTCIMTCDVNYYTTTTKTTICQNVGSHQGKWTEDNFTCDAITCSYNTLPSVTNGQFSEFACTGNGIGDSCQMTCNINHYAPTEKQTTCQHVGTHQGSWTVGDFVCYEHSGWTRWNGHSYVVITALMDWNTANAHCSFLSAHLVYINHATENNFVANMLRNAGGGHGCIGSIQSGRGWEWLDNSYAGFTNWDSSHPPDGFDSCEFIVSSGRWHHHQCSTQCSAICEI